MPIDEIDDSMPKPEPGQYVVRYFEDQAYSVARIEDLAMFVVDAIPFSTFTHVCVSEEKNVSGLI